MTSLFKGHETSARVVSHTLLMLAIHPKVQAKVVSELQQVFGSTGAMLDYNSLNQLVFLDMVLKETMRLFPVLPFSARYTSDEFQIGNQKLTDRVITTVDFWYFPGEYTIPQGATIVVCAYTVQRDKSYWGDDADLFKPERFEPEHFNKVPPYAYTPFTGEFTLQLQAVQFQFYYSLEIF